MVLLEVEQKFSWSLAKLNLLKLGLGNPSLAFKNLKQQTFQDTYYDSHQQLMNSGLYIRKRQHYGASQIAQKLKHEIHPFEWEAKQRVQDSSILRSTFAETSDTSQILKMVRAHLPTCPDSDRDFGLDEVCAFETCRCSFVAKEKFTVVLDGTDFGHRVGEVELLAEDAEKAHAEIEVFMREYEWFFDVERPKGKLTAYFEKFGFPGDRKREV